MVQLVEDAGAKASQDGAAVTVIMSVSCPLTASLSEVKMGMLPPRWPADAAGLEKRIRGIAEPVAAAQASPMSPIQASMSRRGRRC